MSAPGFLQGLSSIEDGSKSAIRAAFGKKAGIKPGLTTPGLLAPLAAKHK